MPRLRQQRRLPESDAMTAMPETIHLKDYAPTPFAIAHVDLTVQLHPEKTRVESALRISPRSNRPAVLVLDGEKLELLGIAINGVPLPPDAYTYKDDKLTLHSPPDGDFVLNISQSCNPSANSALSGLYLSNGMYCTQMEAEGFRRFAFFYDRPDVMATYRVRIEAPQDMPVLLSNGNPVESGTLPDGRRFAVWNDPHPKPTYLFALVGGDLASIHDSFTTAEGRKVALGIYVEKGKETACTWAMECLKESMRWDETRFGRAYDLDVFNIVAVSDFNAGAMENKGLNIFNDKYVLARPETATDTDYVNIERIIAHEYFHNWTGNRITCRDWFQLCLKEGLTVFRDQEFTSDLRSRDVKRIEDVKTLRARQFPEDQGPLSHPVRPSSYMEINNFYTATVYEKGAELCRMLHTLIGKKKFRKAMDLYFERHDGDAATVEEFLACMADASGRDLSHFALWYEQAGTPVVSVDTAYDRSKKRFTVSLKQETPATPGQPDKKPLHIPLAYALLDPRNGAEGASGLIELRDATHSQSFDGFGEMPHLSINRGFSAPIALRETISDDELLFRLAHDTDSFNRWDAGQKLGLKFLKSAAVGNLEQTGIKSFADGLIATLGNANLDDAFKALMLQLPSEAEVTSALAADVDADKVHAARDRLRTLLAGNMTSALQAQMTQTNETAPYRPDTAGTGRRALRYAALGLLAMAPGSAAAELAIADLRQAHSMTAEMGALSALIFAGLPEAEQELAGFHERHKHEHLLVDKWFALNGAYPRDNAAKQVEALTEHPEFRFTTPNRVYALIGSFTGSNLAGFHSADGEGYRFLADSVIRLDAINPQVAARMATAFRTWRQYDASRRLHAVSQMRRILDSKPLSRDVFEIISRTLGAES